MIKIIEPNIKVKLNPEIVSGKKNIFGLERVQGVECGIFGVCEFSSLDNCKVCGNNFNEVIGLSDEEFKRMLNM